MSVPGYENYLDSGVEWLGAVPSHWQIAQTKRFFTRKKEVNVGMRCADRLSLTMAGVVPRSLDDLDGLQSNDFEGYQIFEPNDLAFKLIDLQNIKTSRVGRVPSRGIMSPAYVRLEPHTPELSSFGYWFFQAMYWLQVFNKLGGGVRQTLGPEDLLTLPFASPPAREQVAIAAFLDRETGTIDALVEAQRRLIDLLKEKRQAVISHAVTKGLDPTVPMKDSGVEWLGEVPAHWEVRPFRYALSCIESGTSVNAVDVPARADELGVLKTSCVYSGAFAPNENKTVVAEEVGRVSCPVRGGTLIVSRMNTPDLVGAAGFVKRDVENLFLPDRLWQLHFSGVSPAFAHYWTLTKAYRGQVQIACAGTSSSMQNLSQDQLRSFIFPFPPYPEQLEIVDRLNKATQATDRLMAKAEDAIALLQERRAALISAAVTGKIDVRGLIAKRMEAA